MGSLWSEFEGHFGLLLALEGGFGGTSGSLWDQFLHMKATLEPLWGHFGVTVVSLWAYGRRISHSMHIISPCVGPKRAHKEEIHIFAKDFAWSRRI